MALILARHWWTLALRGILAFLFGITALSWPEIPLSVLVLLFGAYSLLDGLLVVGTAITAYQEFRNWTALLLEGLVGVGIGLVTLLQPGITALTMLWLIATWAILTGILKIGTAIQMRRVIIGEWLLILVGGISVLFGSVLIASPTIGALAVVWLTGAYVSTFGVIMLALALRLRSIRYTVGARSLRMSRI